MKTFAKTPAEVIDYGWDWARWLGTDTVSTSTWTVDAGLTVTAQGNDATSATLEVAAGAAGMRYACVNRITTAGGRTAARTFYISIVAERYA